MSEIPAGVSAGYLRLGGKSGGRLAAAVARGMTALPVPPIEVRASASAPADLGLGSTKGERAAARGQGYTGDQCSNCSSMRMRVAGHCLCCDDCGTTTGCS